MARKLSGKIIDDMRFLEKKKSDSRGNARWLCECIYCLERKVMATDNIKVHRGTKCNNCSNTHGYILEDDEQEIVDAYQSGTQIKTIAHDLSVSVRTIYNILHRREIKLRRK